MNHVIIHPGVVLGRNVKISPFCEIGVPLEQGESLGENPPETVIGDDAVIRSHTVIYAGNIIGRNFQTGHQVVIREHNRIGDDVSVGTKSSVEHHTQIGDGVRIHSQAFIPEFTILCDKAWIGPNAVLTNARYPKGRDVKEKLEAPRIGKSAIIGANATILPGIHIGEQALIGAGSVVVRDVPSRCVAVGNPAVVIKSLDDLPDYGLDGGEEQ